MWDMMVVGRDHMRQYHKLIMSSYITQFVWVCHNVNLQSVTTHDSNTNSTHYQILRSTEWFKINLTLFMSHISHKWENIMNLFDDIYKL